MQANAETINFEADALARENVPAISRPFDHRDVGAQAVPLAVEIHPYAGPVLEASTATDSPSEQECKQSILTQPDIKYSRIRHPGKPNQSIDIQFHLDNVLPSECDKRWSRIVSLQAQIKHPGQGWLNESGSGWNTSPFGDNLAAAGGLSSVNTFRLHKLYYHPGDQLRWRLRLQDQGVQTGDIVGTNIADVPVTPPKEG